MNRNTAFALVVILLALLSGCKNSNNQKPSITGAMGEVLVIMDDKWRNGPAGDALQTILKQAMEGLPQPEPIFTVSITPHRAFTGALRTRRNLVVVNIGPNVENEGVRFFSESSWARGQAMLHINARTPEKFIELVEESELRIVAFLLRAERRRSLAYYTRYPEAKLMENIEKQWDFSMVVPNSFQKNKSSDTFTWLSNETSELSQGLMIYSFPYIGEGTFSREYLLNKRDSVLRQNMPGPSEGSYMSSEHELPITYKSFSLNGHPTVELRGLWKVIGDLMGGPFVLYAHHDAANNRVVVTDAYVYYPDEPKKRNYVWQLESLFHSVKFADGEVDEEFAEEELAEVSKE